MSAKREENKRPFASVMIDGVMWEVYSVPKARMRKYAADGVSCKHDDNGRSWIEVWDQQLGRERLGTLLHELGHALDWDEDDDAVIERRAQALAEVLWRDGWRRLDS